MDADERRLVISGISEKVIGCAFKVSNALGAGFLEKVYENALVVEIRKAGLAVAQQSPITIYYDGIVVGEYIGDLIVENILLVELKAIRAIEDIHMLNA